MWFRETYFGSQKYQAHGLAGVALAEVVADRLFTEIFREYRRVSRMGDEVADVVAVAEPAGISGRRIQPHEKRVRLEMRDDLLRERSDD